MAFQPLEWTLAQVSSQVAVGLRATGAVPPRGGQGLHQLLGCPLAVFAAQPGGQDTRCQCIGQLQGPHSGAQVGQRGRRQGGGRQRRVPCVWIGRDALAGSDPDIKKRNVPKYRKF